MPAFSICIPRFLCCCRSRSHSPEASPTDPHDDAATSHFPGHDPVHTLSPRPSSRLGVPGQGMNAATASSHLSALGHPTDPQNATGHVHADGTLDKFSSQSSQALGKFTHTSVVDSQSAKTFSLHDSVTAQPVHLPCLPVLADPTHSRRTTAPAPQRSPYSITTPSQQRLNPPNVIQPPGQYSPQLQHHNPGMFNQAHNFTVMGTFVEGNVTYNNTTSNRFMEKLLERTIHGAAFDSSDRDPPPRCHPETRLAILERCLYFIANCSSKKKIRWVVGSAGVGKSAILQNVAESPELLVTSQASVFFSINGRNDATKAFLTLSYQLATKSELYRRVIEYEIVRDPSLLQSSLSVHFKKFIIQPFIDNSQLNSAGRVLIIIDGLDECQNPRSQQEILRLIFDLCITYPSSPIVWLIASRPEQHLTSFFSRPNVAPAYEMEEVVVDSDEARADVERFLRDELKEIKASWYSFDPQSEWPDEKDLWKLADAAGGLFAYAHTVIRYIGDPNIANPVSQFSDVLNVIDNHPLTGIPREEHPMALLDALYARILSNVPPKIMIYTRKLLLIFASGWDSMLRSARTRNLLVLCNWLGMTPEEAYAAVNHLQSVLRFPRRDKSHKEKLEPFHKSLIDYISDFSRSGFSPDFQHEAQQLMTECAFRVLKETPDGIDFGDTDYKLWHGTVTRGPGTGEKISLTWPVVQEDGWNDDETRLSLYKLAMAVVIAGMRRGDTTFHNEFCIRLLTTRFEAYGDSFPFFALSDLPFDESRRHEFMTRGILKQMPLKAVDISSVPSLNAVKLRWHRPASLPSTDSADPWNTACDHECKGEWGEGNNQDWVTIFWPNDCTFCFGRLKHQLGNWKTRSPDHTLLVLFTSTGSCCIEFTFVHPEDGISEWTYWFWCHVSLEERKKYGSPV